MLHHYCHNYSSITFITPASLPPYLNEGYKSFYVGILTGATGITIDRSHFSNIGRDQNNYYYTINERDLQTSRKKKRFDKDVLELSERGDIYKHKDVCYTWGPGQVGKTQPRRPSIMQKSMSSALLDRASLL
ncbi:hypothetical protein E1B28_006443 [Marasmius oreades]|uniref:Uncharacterized protein n=1 Tax=Marasmius oreades TaxID=181124 RepID=A0A9P7UVK6_9AGAR|nr:uncharacterized protein E1B28_006443 [Marasmius oreades]KAG7095733.1 hypothetical protein E1B28_006443 [Marasmius oreades]